MYRVGLSQDETSEAMLIKAGLSYVLVEPRTEIVESAKISVGKPYKRGASVLREGGQAFDCSALVAWSAVNAGYAIPRITIDQFVFSKRIEKEDLQPGDLIFANTQEIIHTEGTYFSQVLGKNVSEEPIRTETLEYLPGTKVPHGVDHAGIYIGNGRVVHATCKQGEVVEEGLLDSPSFINTVGYGRIIDDENKRFVVEVPEDKPELRKKEALLEYINKHA